MEKTAWLTIESLPSKSGAAVASPGQAGVELYGSCDVLVAADHGQAIEFVCDLGGDSRAKANCCKVEENGMARWCSKQRKQRMNGDPSFRT